MVDFLKSELTLSRRGFEKKTGVSSYSVPSEDALALSNP